MANLDRAIYQLKRQDEEAFAQQEAKRLHLNYVNLVGYPILPNTLHLMTVDEMLTYKCIPFLRVDTRLKVAITTTDAATLTFLQALADRSQLELSLAYCSHSSYQFGLNLATLDAQKTKQDLTVAVSRDAQVRAMQVIQSRDDLEKKLATASATQVLDLLFAAGTGMAASDIHIEPQETTVRVRFRIDGVLQEIAFLTQAAYKQLTSRVKYLAKLKLDIKNTPQDGRFTIKLKDTDLDVRVSTLPSAFGEVLEMRLLRAHSELISLDELGLTPTALAQIKAAIDQPHGMILVTGPTGSGKTTTLYAVLDTMNKTGVKIITLEDPIEYRIPGIDQVQIEKERGFTFAEALKGVLRQDPDIIMVGEIRDKETADIGLDAGMTGHLFLSTLHTNNAPSSLARLMDMGVEPYKIAGAINLIIAQRLVRKLCTNCQGAGCEQCLKTGYKGRLPIIEVLAPSKLLDDAIMRKASIRELYEIAIQSGMVPMYEDGMQKVAAGLTTEEEVNRVTKELTD